MAERPILFSGPMVRALLDGSKTQTRRVWKMPRGCQWYAEMGGESEGWVIDAGQPWWLHVGEFRCPYGQPGDRLWVREAWAETRLFQSPGAAMVVYREGDNRTDYGGPWKPSIHMRRRDSRILLEITDVRVERLQDISESDADAEGCERLDSERDVRDFNLCPQCGGTGLYTAHSLNGAFPDTDCYQCDTYVKRYQHLWESINGDGAWDANPWVWALSFKRVPPALNASKER